jgi:hypothetical protein
MSDQVTVRDRCGRPGTPRGQLARQTVEAYSELTAHAGELSPEAAQAVGGLRETLTSLVALRTAADLQIADMKRAMEESGAIFHGGGSPCPAGAAHHRALSHELRSRRRREICM